MKMALDVLQPSLPAGRDLPATPDPRVTMPRAALALAALAIPLVFLTAQEHLGPGYEFRDVVSLLLAAVVATAAVRWLRWRPFDDRRLIAIAALQIIFIASLNTMTGGGASPYFALYAPVLALAGWHLRPGQVLAAVLLVVATEIWRAAVIDLRPSISQLTIALPFYGLLAFLALAVERRLVSALVTLRRDQLRTAQTLDAVVSLARADPSVDVLERVRAEAERIYAARAEVVDLQAETAADPAVVLSIADDERYIPAPIASNGEPMGLLQLWRPTGFSPTERRLISILAEVAARVLLINRLRRTTGAAES